MITLVLLHPTLLAPVQHWKLESKSLIRIGRARDNDVIIYNSVVSRHHAEIWKDASDWIIINFGTNGTYVDNQPIIQVSIVNQMIIRLGNYGPRLQILTQELTPNFADQHDHLCQKQISLNNEVFTQNVINEELTQIDFN